MPGKVVRRRTTRSSTTCAANVSSALMSSVFSSSITRRNGESVSVMDAGEVERGHSREEALGAPTPDPKAGAAHEGPGQRDRPRPRLRQFATDIQLRLHGPPRGRSPMGDAIAAPLARLCQGRHVPPIRLDAAAAVAIHRGEIRIGHDHLMAERLQVLRDPLTLRRRLEQNAHPRPAPEHGRQTLTRGRDPSIDDFTVLRHDSDLTFLLVKIDGTILPGWSSPCASRARSASVGAQATTSLRRPAASSYLRASWEDPVNDSALIVVNARRFCYAPRPHEVTSRPCTSPLGSVLASGSLLRGILPLPAKSLGHTR
jgi:hypothetical protein